MSGKQSKAVLSTRIPPELLSKLDALCLATERDRGYHVERAIKKYVENQLWQVEAVKEGIQDADAGRVKPLAEVKEKWVVHSEKNTEK